ncbi:hypothetical protein BCE75_10332 [Isoptericola sp. CG 20/1183]|uniref:Sulfotransferase domain-containing protein n=1 Tax=Isoptericola halotolerans TaxID=300560 RepID=A0ABX5EFD7_9MICO|nr:MULTISPECIES: DUF6270 domain-containing protein [Isoptericola]PRZ08107.1 hypothetical protein BCL65_10332 [Isoptericola halotolerans]PRZ08905.1 hypothetical protein BCE75_10332 [Isoptericola sp. CG 20/1183]
MSKHRVFIYGSCVSRDTFEHFDPEQFELVQYVARQSALSAYTRPVTMIQPPTLDSPFKQRMVSGDYASNLQSLIPEAAAQTDLVLVDLTDERLGAYVLPDGSVVTRSTELIESGAEARLPAGTQHLPFGSDQHFQYWSQGMDTVGELFRQHMPRAAVVLLDVPWAEFSEGGHPTPSSFGVSASTANPILRAYIQAASQALGAEVISLSQDDVLSNPTHPWGDAPFHYTEDVYMRIVWAIAGAEGRRIWEQSDTTSAGGEASSAELMTGVAKPQNSANAAPSDHGMPNLVIAGTQQAGAEWIARQLDTHPDFFVAKGKGKSYFNKPNRLKSEKEEAAYRGSFQAGQQAAWRVDCTSDYFWHSEGSPFGPKKPNTPQNINRQCPPDTRVLLVLREPVARAIAAYWHYFSVGKLDPNRGILRASPNFGLVDLGFYRRHFEHWASILGEDRIDVILYDDLANGPQSCISSILNRLGASPHGQPDSGSESAPLIPQKPWLEAFKERSPISPQEIIALHELYRRDVEFVQRLMGRDLPEWSDLDSLIREAQ